MKEIEAHLPVLLQVAHALVTGDSSAGYEFILPIAATLHAKHRATIARLVAAHGAGIKVRLVDSARSALAHARASIVASGTATVEAALVGNPFIVVYRVSPVTYAIAKRVVKVPHVAMANLIAGRRVVPELIQHDFTATNVVQQLSRLLPDGPDRESMVVELKAVREALQAHHSSRETPPTGAIERVTEVICEELGVASSSEALGLPLK